MISAKNITKRFGSRTVLSDISLNITPSDSIAFIGRNGSGKSTLLKILAGLLPCEKGQLIHSKKLKFAYVPERFPPINLSALDYITQIGQISGLSKKDAITKGNHLFEALFMQDMTQTPIKYLSKGTMQKVAVVQAFLVTPDVLLLDEPIAGQDMASQRVFMDMVNQLNSNHGVAVLCSCHEDYMVNAIAKTVYEIIDGKLHQKEHTRGEANISRLLFYQNHQTPIPETILNQALKIEQLQGNEVAIYVETSITSHIIKEMLCNNNFKLGGVNNERFY